MTFRNFFDVRLFFFLFHCCSFGNLYYISLLYSLSNLVQPIFCVTNYLYVVAPFTVLEINTGAPLIHNG